MNLFQATSYSMADLCHGHNIYDMRSGVSEVMFDLFWIRDHQEEMVKLAAIVDRHGELFLVDQLTKLCYWGYKSKCSSKRSLYVAKGVNDYIDCHHDNLLYRHCADSAKVISFNLMEKDLETKKRDLQNCLTSLYPSGTIDVQCGKFEIYLDYKTGKESKNVTDLKFKISIQHTYISHYSKDLVTLRWKLVYSMFEAFYPESSCPYRVFQTQSLKDFIELCGRFKIDMLPGGRKLDDYKWMDMHESTDKIKLVNEYEPTENKKYGTYEGSSAVIFRFPQKGHGSHHILKLLKSMSQFIQFLGWKQTDSHLLLAFEECADFQTYTKGKKNECGTIVSSLVKHVYMLHELGLCHGNLTPTNVFMSSSRMVKLGMPRLIEGVLADGKATDLKSVAKMILSFASDGGYEFQLKANNLKHLS